jgi:hypothetical protein
MASDVVNLGPGFRYTRYNVVNLCPDFRYTRYNVVNNIISCVSEART